MKRAYVIGAGLAGLAAAVALTREGYAVTVSEAAGQAGGRCRSYEDRQLGLTIDNGNHLVLSGNRTVADYLATVGASDRLAGPADARFPFVDLRDDARWTLRMNDGPIPWWTLFPDRRVPGTKLTDYVALQAMLRESPAATVAEQLPASVALRERLVEPLLLAALNTPLESASAALARAILRETLATGGAACAPRIATPTLAAAFVDPALDWLTAHGATVRLGRRLRGIAFAEGRLARLTFADGDEAIGEDEPVVLAVPAWVAADLVPGLVVPDAHHAILNAHFALAPPAGAEPIVGVVGGAAQWLFAFPDRFSVTISAADALVDADRDALAAQLWEEIARVYRLDAPMPPWRILCEKRATFAATPAQARRRPSATTRWRNLLLAGDWTATGLPSTIEGALRSGLVAGNLGARLGA
ncbi:MAG: FAD-dependent oxidoreductase [Sphingomonadaceae bacterium]|nr:FAD-dependent oxidoreductase [Sphingomonadaceae bacterium]